MIGTGGRSFLCGFVLFLLLLLSSSRRIFAIDFSFSALPNDIHFPYEPIACNAVSFDLASAPAVAGPWSYLFYDRMGCGVPKPLRFAYTGEDRYFKLSVLPPDSSWIGERYQDDDLIPDFPAKIFPWSANFTVLSATEVLWSNLNLNGSASVQFAFTKTPRVQKGQCYSKNGISYCCGYVKGKRICVSKIIPPPRY